MSSFPHIHSSFPSHDYNGADNYLLVNSTEVIRFKSISLVFRKHFKKCFYR